ncbi:MAG: septation protein A [Burkholderiaceae bacterium]|jgi:intracellular septation protein|nr:septation protein A [Burkholderiaceae bacterium]
MRALLDFIPILLFFGAYKLWGIYVATAVLMAATVLQMGLIYVIEHKLALMHKVTLGLILIFGALTLVLHDIRFLEWKFTLFYAAIALVLLAAHLLYRKNLLKTLLGMQIELPDAVWTRLNYAWVIYCLFMAALNSWIVVFFSTQAWVNFKAWSIVLSIAFIIGQGVYMAPHLKFNQAGKEDNKKEEKAGS